MFVLEFFGFLFYFLADVDGAREIHHNQLQTMRVATPQCLAT